MWIGTFGNGINYVDLKDSEFKFFNHTNELSSYPIDLCYKVRCITSDTDDYIWIGTTAGLIRFNSNFVSTEDIKFEHFIRKGNHSNGLTNNDIHNILISKRNDMYITTFGGGLHRVKVDAISQEINFEAFNTLSNFPFDILLSIAEDDSERLWIVSEEDLCLFNPYTEESQVFTMKEICSNLKFNEGTSLKIANPERIVFNSTKGTLYFNPDSIHNSTYIPPIIFSDFHLSERTLSPYQLGILTKSIDDMEHIELSHKYNGFNIRYAALDYKNPKRIQYAYKLEGFENNWNYVGNQQVATYTNIPKGEYILRVQSTNSDGIWSHNTKTIKITIHPSFWETLWAYLLYVLFIILIILTTTYILFTIFQLKHKVSVEKQITDIKLRFFTNISHELRTPLTLITGPVEQILKSGKLEEKEKEQLLLVERNTNRMLRLVNQILDFRKIQNQRMKLQVHQIDLKPFIQNIMKNFYIMADEHNIDFILDSTSELPIIWADADKLEKILFNLISNAFKYTLDYKQIYIIIKENDDKINISIQDQGIGISEKRQKRLFIRFENLNEDGLFNQASSGIGLSLTKELVEMHHGTISFESEIGKGSVFTIQLLKGKNHFDNDTEFIFSDGIRTNIEISNSKVFPENFIRETEVTLDKEKETLLIVEDNDELRFFIKSIFFDEFNIIEAENGNVGLTKAKEYIPDIIISDIMMPDVDGLEMLRNLHDNTATSHIPIILLTAKSNIENQIEGLEHGAEDYITKPFSSSCLKARIFNLLEKRKKLQSYFSSNIINTVSSLEQHAGNNENAIIHTLRPNDQNFIEKVTKVILSNIDKGDLRIEDIYGQVNMSRSVFSKKLKSITGLSPVEMLRKIRMQRAAQLIATGEFNMAEIAYMVGINDSHYFSKCFKQQYGITPTEYKERHCP